jgi:hypothetical protein
MIWLQQWHVELLQHAAAATAQANLADQAGAVAMRVVASKTVGR